jgi:hypothetical protein
MARDLSLGKLKELRGMLIELCDTVLWMEREFVSALGVTVEDNAIPDAFRVLTQIGRDGDSFVNDDTIKIIFATNNANALLHPVRSIALVFSNMTMIRISIQHISIKIISKLEVGCYCRNYPKDQRNEKCPILTWTM